MMKIEKRMLNGMLLVFFLMAGNIIIAQNPESNHGNKFEQIDNLMWPPNNYRGADGAPGPDYWQQKVDYKIQCALDTKENKLTGSETITYHNNSPVSLRYLWLQLDENQHAADADNHIFNGSSMRETMSESALTRLENNKYLEKFGCNITKVTSATGSKLKYTINKTMMRVDLPQPLKPGEKYVFNVDWNYYLIDRMNTPSWGRGGFEYFEKDKNYLYTITQWFPRLCVYNDVEGWQNKQFTGRGEFALQFGDYDVKMSLPEDYVVASTGACQNYEVVLNATEKKRLAQAKKSDKPVQIVTLEEAKAVANGARATKNKTWHFKAENVRDFAWGASTKFAWDAQNYTNSEGKDVLCMSYYGKEAYPIYNRYSTKAVAHTLKVYDRYTLPYPYPVAISVEAANGMEYPMISFNPGRAEEDGTYTERAKQACISVVIHEVGHNYYPMIINSDERKWSWMDEGLNTFVQFIAEQEFDNNYKSRRGPAEGAISYMKQDKNRLEPIMTNSDNIIGFGANAYMKPATALNILRETVMGRELFDFAFAEYGRRWAFKHPTPTDFFRTMEEASGVDLDWFWKGWFYGIDAVDVSLDSIKWYKADLVNDPEKKEREWSDVVNTPFDHITKKRNKDAGMEFEVEKDPELVDYYTNYKPWETKDSIISGKTYLYDETFTKEEKEKMFGKKNYYELNFTNVGGLVTPLIIEWTFKDGTKEIDRIPAEVWRKNENNLTKVFVKEKEATGIVLDPYKETADVDMSNNLWPVKELPTRFQVFKKHRPEKRLNPMQKAIKRGDIIKP